MTYIYVFTGGPYDGQERATGGETELQVTRRPEIPLLTAEPPPAKQVDFTTVRGTYQLVYDWDTDCSQYVWQGWDDER